MNVIQWFANASRPFWLSLGLALIPLLGIFDYVTGQEIASSLFYLIPVSILAWFIGRHVGLAASLLSAIVWHVADVSNGQPYSHPAIAYWNSGVRLGFFVVVTLLLTALRRALDHEKELARTDHLTGAVNPRSFTELLTLEMNLAARSRQPFAVAYIDLDDFKAINDRFGHSIGDRVLQHVVTRARTVLRKTDIVARFGGDEFAVLLSNTGMAGAQIAISKLQRALLDEMHRNRWPVTFSIGVLTCQTVPPSIDDAMREVDGLMYAAKRGGKNAARFGVFDGTVPLMATSIAPST